MVHWNRVVGELATGKRKHEYVPLPSPPEKQGRGKRPWRLRRLQRLRTAMKCSPSCTTSVMRIWMRSPDFGEHPSKR
jgi:hypothetical protein